MNAIKMTAIAMIIAGVLALVYGGFSYTKETQDVRLGSLDVSVHEKQTVNIPIWIGVGAVAVGSILLVLGGNKR